MKREDTRLDVYKYWKQCYDHLGGDTSKIFNGELVYPRQFEIHLPSNHIRSCNFNCDYCAGGFFDKSLGTWEHKALVLLNKLGNKIPFHVYGGAYSEPIMNPYYMAFLRSSKENGCHLGIHTSGCMLKRLEESCGWIHELCRIAEDRIDYLSISLDAGAPESHCSLKRTNHNWFDEIIWGIRKAVEIRNNRGYPGPAVRICYLMNRHNCSEKDIGEVVRICKEIGVDSLRFSIPFANYNQSFDKVREYRANVEQAFDDVFYSRVKQYLSTSKTEVPYIFWNGPEFTDVDLFDFNHCAYGYYQITYGADGGVYKCSTTATPTAKQCRLGMVTDSLDEFEEMIVKNYNKEWDPQKMCFDKGIRCNRMGIEINRAVDFILDGGDV